MLKVFFLILFSIVFNFSFADIRLSFPEIKGNLSGITYNEESKTFFLIQNNYGQIFEYDLTLSRLLRKINIKYFEDNDTEDIQYLGKNKFAISIENNSVLVITIPNQATEVDLKSSDTVKQLFYLPPPRKKNKGLEGLCYIPEENFFSLEPNKAGYFLGLQEDNPKRTFAFPWLEVLSKYSYKKNLPYIEPLDTRKYLKHIMSDLSGCYYQKSTKTLFLLSHESSRIMTFNLRGEKIKSYKLPTWFEQYEGITQTPTGEFVLVSEPSEGLIIDNLDKYVEAESTH